MRMSDKRQIIPIVGLVATFAMAAYMVVRLHAQVAEPVADLSNAVAAEVLDGQGQAVLRGQFAAVEEEDDDVERKAPLGPVGSDTDAGGEAEIEFAKSAPAQQEVEFSVHSLQPGIAVTFLIDGQTVGQATVDRRGRAEFETEIARPGSR
jgi:hypothetical protein